MSSTNSPIHQPSSQIPGSSRTGMPPEPRDSLESHEPSSASARRGSPNSTVGLPQSQRTSRAIPTNPTHNRPGSLNQKTPARSFYHLSYQGSVGSADFRSSSSQRVREETAELASLALSDAASSFNNDDTPSLHQGLSPLNVLIGAPAVDDDIDEDEATPRGSERFRLPDVIPEISEPTSPRENPSSVPQSPGASVLSEMLRSSFPRGEYVERSHDESQQKGRPSRMSLATGALPDDGERAPLLSKRSVSGSSYLRPNRHDLESQTRLKYRAWNWIRSCTGSAQKGGLGRMTSQLDAKSLRRENLWSQAIVPLASFLPPVLLGILLNILDALSYGMILFPLGQPVFASLGPDGISMFYIEVVPFFHRMAFTILNHVGEDDSKSVLATTILSFSISSIITGMVFFGLGASKLGSLIGFFPRHILIGCIGGVGWFLIATGLEVSARLDGNLEYNLETLKKLVQLDTVFLWTVPLLLAIILLFCQRWVKHPLLVPCYFLVIPAVFYFFVAAIPNLQLDQLRQMGWVFDLPASGEPFYHFYTLYDFRAVNWAALVKTIPAMFALTFFGILHVPINVPALGFSTGEDNVDVNRELIAHGISNALSGFAGSIQNYLVYTNSLLFIRSGGDSRVAGVMLAIGTLGIMTMGPTLIGYIPIMVVGALIFLLGIDLMREALRDTWGRVHRLEYLTIVAIVVTMGAWDFVAGILVGIVLACVNFVVQTSRKSAIRATYSGEVAGSTVRRHPVQYRFLRNVGRQTHVTKLAGFLFFGTIVNVESRIRALLEEDAFEKRPIRFLILDLLHVTGVDFSAAEAFTRINRTLRAKNVAMIMCSVSREGEIGQSLQNVGLWDEENDVQIFQDLNAALEYCENELLKTFYSRRDALTQRHAQGQSLDVPQGPHAAFTIDTMFSSPRRHHLQHMANLALKEHDPAMSPAWQNFKQPLPLILQTFQDLTRKNEDFWFGACPYFRRKELTKGTVLYSRGDEPDGFYLLEEGILRAEYQLPQGRYYESIVAGTTCGELPFFSETERTATVVAERDSVAWLMDEDRWNELQEKQPDVARELLRISLKLTSERMSAITS
ncbi:MAG: hypothetical protein M1817_001878 [Caeruleum heppii]|nr:MAG: hypothetical protein M1817_001878 [Caeruleum heppii]